MDSRELRRLLDNALTSPAPGDALEFLLRQGVLDDLPELAAIVALEEDSMGLHKDVWGHTKAVVGGVPNLLELRWAALLHDIGKAKTRRILPNGRVTFHNHDLVGARQVDGIQSRLRLFDPPLLSTVRALVFHHLRPASYKHTWTDSAVRRLITEIGNMDTFAKLMSLSRADLTTKVPARRQRALARAVELETRVLQVMAEDNRPRLPKGTMSIVIDRLQRPAGAWVRDVQAELERRLGTGELAIDLTAEAYADIAIQIVIDNSVEGNQ